MSIREVADNVSARVIASLNEAGRQAEAERARAAVMNELVVTPAEQKPTPATRAAVTILRAKSLGLQALTALPEAKKKRRQRG